MKVDMSPEAITGRLRTMEQLWELSVSLMQAKPLEKDLSKDSQSAPLVEESLEKDRQHLEHLPSF